MFIQSVSLESFRNYTDLSIDLDSKINIFYGANAQGKTNLLEAIYLCATGRSHRTSYDREMIRWDLDQAHIKLILQKEERQQKIDMHLRRNSKKGAALNGVPLQKLGDLLGTLHVVMFSPEDLALIKSGPKERRRFLDIELCQLYPVYYYDLQQYHRLLKQRNHLLKTLQRKKERKNDLVETLSIWDEQLISLGSRIIESREEFINQLNEKIRPIHSHITGKKEQLTIRYEQDISIEEYEKKLNKSRQRDIEQGNTSVGPHRDDLSFWVNGMDIRLYGSQGQQRSVVLSLKLGEIELVKETIDDVPVLLLDDVLSELDSQRQAYLMDYISDLQTFLTCTGVEDLLLNKFSGSTFYHVKEGKIKKGFEG
ncbi:MAG: DNA replication/repair protein RecF [Epulopiscium sp.]|nr:DNA replication/repair protein RecF [Candidatus Epulonipiscium sp.]